jgi:hypothetical protein
MDLTQKLTGVIRTKQCSVKAEAGGSAKKINLSIDYSDCTIEDVLTGKAVAHDVIAWQNGQGRAKFSSWTDGQTVSIKASSPGASAPIDPMVSLLAEAKAKGVTIEDLLKLKLAAMKL